MSSSSPEIILTSSPDGPITAYVASTGATVGRFIGSRSPCRGLTMVGKALIAASHVFPETVAGSIHIYNSYSSTFFNNFPVPEPVAPLIATDDGAYILAGGVSGSIYSISLSSGDVIRSFPAFSNPISCLQLSNDGSLLISGSDDGTIVVIPTFRLVEDATSSVEENPKDMILQEWKAHSDSITAFKFGLCSSTLISCSLDCTCKFWNLANGILLHNVSFPCAIFGIVLDSSESGFYAAGGDGLIYKGLTKIRSKKMLHNRANELVNLPRNHNGSIVSLDLVNEGKNLVSASEDGSVLMWNIENGQVTMVLGNNNNKKNMVSTISDMIVVRSDYFGEIIRKGNNSNNYEGSSGFCSSILCNEEIVKTLKHVTEVGEVMDVVDQDKKRAIDMLESAISMYERLLRLILKEATKSVDEKEEEEEDEKEDK